MFFIGIFGIEQKRNIISTNQNIICPICSAYGSYDIIKSYNFFHAFFIPLFKWNRQYSIQTRCCNNLCHLDDEIGFKIENGEDVEINGEHIHCNDFYTGYKLCPRCSSQVDSSFKYCPYCGNKI